VKDEEVKLEDVVKKATGQVKGEAARRIVKNPPLPDLRENINKLFNRK